MIQSSRIVWEREGQGAGVLVTPERTAAVAQILVDAGALRITAEGELLTQTNEGRWTPYTSYKHQRGG